MGWLDPSIKKPIPKLPRCIGVVTSKTGAAIEDIRNVTARRFPSMPLILYPASVQGERAAKEIAAAIRKADAEHRCDVLIVGRGGGSMEDLWCFNEPEVAQAIHECSLPVISAVGHEIDFPLRILWRICGRLHLLPLQNWRYRSSGRCRLGWKKLWGGLDGL